VQMTIVSVASSFFPIGPAGTGAEQVVAMIDRAIVERGWKSIVVAAEGSTVAGHLISALPAEAIPAACLQSRTSGIRACILDACRGADVIHFHGLGFEKYLPPDHARILITLHAPLGYYPASIFKAPSLKFIAVSRHQALGLPNLAALRIINNGIDLQRYRPRLGKREHLVFIGRISLEKGAHIALRIAHRLGLSLVIAGPVPSFPKTRRYFEEYVAPGLDERRRYIGAIGTEDKVRLLASARCVLMPSLCPETSSLVAMEALGCGVPVIAFASGALPEVVEDGITGFVVGSEDTMARAVQWAAQISPLDCRARAERRFDSRQMTREYLSCYEKTPPLI
jgi:glycosyltransferase involved in cell wall biosynthesis